MSSPDELGFDLELDDKTDAPPDDDDA
jgi:hypothetical protein